MFSTLEDAQAAIRNQQYKMIDLKFTDLAGRWHHVTVPAGQFNEHLMRDGVGFDGSAVGLRSVKAGDMVLLPDLSTAFRDPFWELPTLSFICSAYEADTKLPFPRDPRNIATRAEQYMQELGVADESRWGRSTSSTSSTMSRSRTASTRRRIALIAARPTGKAARAGTAT